MQTFSIQFKNFQKLEEFITRNNILSYNNILIQIFSGVIKSDHLLSISSGISKLLPQANIIGTTTSGEIQEGTILNNTILICFSVFEYTSIKSTLINMADKMNIDDIKNLICDDTKALIVFSNGLQANVESILKEVHNIKPGILIAGGGTGNNRELQEDFVFNEAENTQSGIVIASLSSKNLITNSDYILNWTPIGKEMVVTKANGNILYELDNTPILQIYKKYLGEEISFDFPSYCLDFPLIIDRAGIKVARDPLKKSNDGGLIFAGNFNIGEMVRFSFANIEELIDNASYYFNMYEKIPAESIFIYSCAARKTLLGDKLEDELNVLNSIAPANGFFTYGEYYQHLNTTELLNVTTTFIMLSEIDRVKKRTLKKTDNKKIDSIKKALTHLVKVTIDELQYVSTHDTLTGLYNRGEYAQRINQKIASAKRYGEFFGIVFIDIDFFKLINDNYGHVVGDNVLKEFAKLLQSNIRRDDFIARWGGEEFIIIAKYVKTEHLEVLVRKLQKSIWEASFDPVPKVTASFGITEYRENDDAESLLRRVDNALYTAKRTGRDKYIIG